MLRLKVEDRVSLRILKRRQCLLAEDPAETGACRTCFKKSLGVEGDSIGWADGVD